MATSIAFSNIVRRLKEFFTPFGPTELARARTLLQEITQDGTLDLLEQNIRSQIRWEEWRPGMRAPTGVLWEEAYPVLKEDPNRRAYIVYAGGTIYFETEHFQTRTPLRTTEDVRSSAEALIEQLVKDRLEVAIAEEIVARW